MEIHTPRLLLRPVTADDLATTYAYAGNLETLEDAMKNPNFN